LWKEGERGNEMEREKVGEGRRGGVDGKNVWKDGEEKWKGKSGMRREDG
jgi:hypothetical protein